MTKSSDMLNRKDFINKVAEATGRKPATVSQCLYAVGFKPALKQQEGHMIRPYFETSQIKQAADLVLRR